MVVVTGIAKPKPGLADTTIVESADEIAHWLVPAEHAPTSSGLFGRGLKIQQPKFKAQ